MECNFFRPNEFQIEILDPKDLAIISTGGFGAVLDTESGTITLTLPPGTELEDFGLKPGLFFLRITSTNPSDANCDNGNLILLTIGYPLDSISLIIDIFNGFDYVCPSYTGTFSIVPDPYRVRDGSTYDYSLNGALWLEDMASGIVPIITTPNVKWEFCVREHNGNCYGPWACDSVTVSSVPEVIFDFPTPLCAGQRQLFEVEESYGATYSWYVNDVLQPFSSSKAYLEFPEPGDYQIRIVASNACGSNDFSRVLEVVSSPEMDITPDTFICFGESVTLEMSNGPLGIYSWWIDTNKVWEDFTYIVSPGHHYFVLG